jgi:uncharacterized protein
LSKATAGPVAPASRIVEVDMVRGFALFGVLLVNMYNFGADSIAWNSPTDRAAFAIMHVFFESKSWTLFSILFGIGFAVQLQRANARAVGFLPVYLRRLAALFAIGAAHALLFDGDILMLYAEFGLVLLVVHRLPMRGLLFLAFGLMLVFPLARFVSAGDRPAGTEEIESVAEARAWLEQAQHTHVYAIGSLAEVAVDNASAIPALPLEDLLSPESGLAVFAMFLLGFSVGRSGVLDDIPGHVAAIARLRAWGLGFGFGAMAAEQVLAATTGYAVFGPSQSGPVIQLTGDILFAFGTPALAFGYAATLVLAARTPRGRVALAPLAGVGRLALTVYLTQTLMFTTLFYGYGAGQVFRLSPAAVTAWAVAIFGVQIIACHWWSSRFRFGPVEWMWRSLTYLRWQPLRLQNN